MQNEEEKESKGRRVRITSADEFQFEDDVKRRKTLDLRAKREIKDSTSSETPEPNYGQDPVPFVRRMSRRMLVPEYNVRDPEASVMLGGHAIPVDVYERLRLLNSQFYNQDDDEDEDSDEEMNRMSTRRGTRARARTRAVRWSLDEEPTPAEESQESVVNAVEVPEKAPAMTDLEWRSEAAKRGCRECQEWVRGEEGAVSRKLIKLACVQLSTGSASRGRILCQGANKQLYRTRLPGLSRNIKVNLEPIAEEIMKACYFLAETEQKKQNQERSSETKKRRSKGKPKRKKFSIPDKIISRFGSLFK